MRPDDRSYSSTHEWVRLDGDTAVIGITDFAVEQLGELVFLDLPEPGGRVQRGEAFGEVESVKAVSDLNSPVDGEILEVNAALTEDLGPLQNDPFESGWLLRVKVAGPDALAGLADAAAYEKLVEAEG
ncbi:MAG: glycine cleavage system protein GcvH [Planctomycetota bacterium]|nr:MAG: glycine cleavage system protein GcvH [Planctomycetota bacterium]